MKRSLLAFAVATSLVAGAALGRAAPAAAGVEAASADAAGRATLTVRSTRFGRVLFDGRGRVLYGFTGDRRGGPSQCYGACARAWPVYFSSTSLRAGTGVKRSLIGTVRRRDGRRQVTYNGWPLYYYAHEGPGEIKCQNVFGFGGLWLVVRPSGRLLR